MSTIIQIIKPITRDIKASYITCCLINKVESTTNIERMLIITFGNTEEFCLVSNIANINRKEYRQ